MRNETTGHALYLGFVPYQFKFQVQVAEAFEGRPRWVQDGPTSSIWRACLAVAHPDSSGLSGPDILGD